MEKNYFFRKYLILCLLLFPLMGCSNSEDTIVKMPNDSDFYKEKDWTWDVLEQHFIDSGFKDVSAIECEPDRYNYDNNLAYIELLSETEEGESITEWDEGDEFPESTQIKIWFISPELMTPFNSSDLKSILTNNSMSYQSFSKKYDKRELAFEGVVNDHVIFMGGTSHIIDITGIDGEGLVIRIKRGIGADIDYSVKTGDKVFVYGEVDKSDSDYFKQLCIVVSKLKKE